MKNHNNISEIEYFLENWGKNYIYNTYFKWNCFNFFFNIINKLYICSSWNFKTDDGLYNYKKAVLFKNWCLNSEFFEKNKFLTGKKGNLKKKYP